MNRLFSRTGVLATAFVLAFSFACDDDDPPLPDNLVNFEASTLGLGDDVDEAEFTVNLSRAATVDTDITISFTTEGVAYGQDFTTDPAATGDVVVITIPQGASSASFKVIRESGVFLEGDEQITFTITSAGGEIVTGATTEVVLSFSSIVSTGAELTLNGIAGNEPGSSAANAVFVDLSENRQVAAERASWDLAFYNGDDFRVLINNTTAATAVEVDATDLTTVSSDDVNPDDLVVGHGLGTFDIVDDTEGDLSNTVIAGISATDSENKVYVISRAGGTGTVGDVEDFVKVRITRKDDGYTLQYAKINETTIKSVDIAKGDTHTFEYFSITSGETVAFEPARDSWDIQWTWSMYRTGAPGHYIPYAFSDLVFINYLNGVEAAEVMVTGEVTYDSFGEDNLGSVTFTDDRNTIASSWRTTSPPAEAGVATDRFYLIKDAAGNIYKLKFVSFHANDGGTRGKPVIAYALVKKADA